MNSDVHIVALGARTPVGLSAESTAAAIRAGISRIAEHPFMIDADGERLKCGFDRSLECDVLGIGRLLALATHALREVVAKVRARPGHGPRITLLLVLPEPRAGFGQEAAASFQRAFAADARLIVPGVAVVRASEGHAGGVYGLQLASQLLTGREADLCIVTGVDSYFDADTLDWLDSDRRLARTGTRSGFVPGEGATMVALTTTATRLKFQLPSLARLRSVACSVERGSANSPEGLLGGGLTSAIGNVGQRLRRTGDVFSDVYCDINGERDRTDDWGFALLRTSEFFRDGTAYTTSVSQCGDLGAATVGLNCALAVCAWERGYAAGPNALVWGASWNGLRGAALIEPGLADR